MDILVSSLVGGTIVAAAALLALSHVRAWRRLQEENLNQRDYSHHERQYRRRIQTAGILGVVGVAIVVGQILLTHTRVSPWVLLIYWCVVVLLLAWMCLLAAVDFLVTRHHYAQIRDGYVVEEARLRRELRQIRLEGNGHDDSEPDG